MRSYELTRLDEMNVRRSLSGAARRSKDGLAWLLFTTKSAKAPGFQLDDVPGGGCVLNIPSTGKVEDGWLLVDFLKYETDGSFTACEGKIRLDEIVAPINVFYHDKVEAEAV